MRTYDAAGNHKLTHCLAISFLFFVVYFLIHVGLNLAEPQVTECAQPCSIEQKASAGSPPLASAQRDGEPEAFFEKSYARDLAGPFSISLCSSLLIFSFSVFLLQGMEHLSAAAPFSFLKAFFIFVSGLIIIQIAGHAEIFRYSSSFGSQSESIKTIVKFLSISTLPTAFFSLYILERYQVNIYRAVSKQLPDAVFSHHPHPNALAFFTILSIALTFVKSWMHYYEFVMASELFISVLVVGLIFRPDILHHFSVRAKSSS